MALVEFINEQRVAATSTANEISSGLVYPYD